MKHELHPLCTLFPRIEGPAFDELVADIKANGLRQAIVVTTSHEILDGGNRYRACLEAGVEPLIEVYGGHDPVGYVLSANLHRRHMTAGQAAAVVAAAADWSKAHARGGDRKSDQSATLHFDSAADRAAASGASVRTQKMADKVARADPKLAAQVARGEKSLPKAVDELDAIVNESKRKPKAAPKLEPVTVDAPDMDDQITALVERVAALEAENALLKRATDPNVEARIREMAEYTRSVERRRDELMDENAQLIRQVKAMQRRAA